MSRQERIVAAATLCPRENKLPTGESSLDLQWRLAVFDALRRGDARYYDQCNLGEVLSDPKVFTSAEKASASEAVILAGQLQLPNDAQVRQRFEKQWAQHKCDVIMKASFPRIYPAFSAGVPNLVGPLDAEVMLYEFLDQLVRQRVTPNLVVALGTFDCTMQQLAAQTPRSIFDPLTKEARKIFAQRNLTLQGSDVVRFLVLERGRGDSLQNLLDKRAINEEAMISLLAQIIYTVATLNERNIRHADLHLGNVFIDRLSDRSTVINYLPAPGRSPVFFVVPTYGYVAKLYDWDRGGVYSGSGSPQRWPAPSRLISNSISVDFCPSTSSCGSNSKADIFTPLAVLFYKLATNAALANSMPRVAQFLTDVVDERLLEFAAPSGTDNFQRRGGFPFRLCRGPLADACAQKGIDNRTQQQCSGPWEPADCLHKTPLQMLEHPIFSPYMRSRARNDAFVGPHVYGNWPNKAIAKDVLNGATPVELD
jgi:serine/threonine protein kinase